LSAQRKELQPLLDLFEQANVGVALFVNLHSLKSSLEFLDLFFHVVSFGFVPSVVHVLFEDCLALSNMVPKTLHEGDFILDFLDFDLRSFDSGGVLEFLGIVSQLSGLVNEDFDLTIDIL